MIRVETLKKEKSQKKSRRRKKSRKIFCLFFFSHIFLGVLDQVRWNECCERQLFDSQITSRHFIFFFFHRAFISVIREGGEVWGGNARKRKKSKKPKIKQQQNGKKKWRKKHHQIVTSPCFIFPTFICCLLQFIHPFSLPWRSRFLTLYRADL